MADTSVDHEAITALTKAVARRLQADPNILTRPTTSYENITQQHSSHPHLAAVRQTITTLEASIQPAIQVLNKLDSSTDRKLVKDTIQFLFGKATLPKVYLAKFRATYDLIKAASSDGGITPADAEERIQQALVDFQTDMDKQVVDDA